MNSITLPSHAKVNIGLRILNRRPDGYHTIHTVFQELEWHDSVTLTKQPQGCMITTNMSGIPCDDTNTCAKAYHLLKNNFPDIGGVNIHLQKVIPPGTGLGGGSGNAATVLKGLNKLYHLSLTAGELESLASRIGADVPFFIKGGTQIGDGIGERLTPVSSPVKGIYLLILPELSISTAWAYGAWKNCLESSEQKPNFAHFFYGTTPSFSIFENDFERIVIPAHPEIGIIKNRLLRMGAEFAGLSGSGSTVFGIFDDEADARLAESKFQPTCRTILTTPANL